MVNGVKGILLAYVCLLCLFGVQPAKGQLNQAAAQLGIELAPYMMYDYTSDAYYAHLRYARIASSKQIDPDAKGTGLVRTVFAALGARTTDFSTFDFRWRAGLISMDFIRTPISMGLTLVDYNKIELLELDVQWVNLRVGPSLFIGDEANHFSLRAIGTGGVTTLKIGTFAYESLEASSQLNDRKRSYEIGYLGEAKLYLANRVSLSGAFSYRHLLGGLRPKRYRATGILGVRLTNTLSLQGYYMLEDMRLSRTSLDRQLFGGEMLVLF